MPLGDTPREGLVTRRKPLLSPETSLVSYQTAGGGGGIQNRMMQRIMRTVLSRHLPKQRRGARQESQR